MVNYFQKISYGLLYNQKFTLLINRLTRKSIINTSILSAFLAVNTHLCPGVKSAWGKLVSTTVDLDCPTLLLLRNAGQWWDFFVGSLLGLMAGLKVVRKLHKWCIILNLVLDYDEKIYIIFFITSKHGHFIFRKSQGIWYYNQVNRKVIYFFIECFFFRPEGVSNRVYRKNGTDLCIITVKSLLRYYKLHNSLVYTIFYVLYLRAIVHCSEKYSTDQLIFLLLECLCLVQKKQELCIRCGAETSPCFIISIEVRKGRILSPSLFAVYMGDLSSLLKTSRIRCHIDDVYINMYYYVFCADHLYLMAPCAIALQELTNVCYQYSNAIDLNFNGTQSFCVAFTPTYYKLLLSPLSRNSLRILLNK